MTPQSTTLPETDANRLYRASISWQSGALCPGCDADALFGHIDGRKIAIACTHCGKTTALNHHEPIN